MTYFNRIFGNRMFKKISVVLNQYNSLAYPLEFGYGWRPKFWRVQGSSSQPSLSRIELYYDYRFRSYVAGLTTGESRIFGLVPSSFSYKLISWLIIRLLWFFGSGYRFVSPLFILNESRRSSSANVLEFSHTRGFYDIYSPLAVIFYFYFILRFVFVGPSELHYRFNPNFYLYINTLDLDRLPYNGFRYTPHVAGEVPRLIFFHRKNISAFSEDDQNFIAISSYYRSWQGKINTLIWLFFFLPLALPLVTSFHFFFRPIISRFVWGFIHLFIFFDRLEFFQPYYRDNYVVSAFLFIIASPIRYIINFFSARINQLRSVIADDDDDEEEAIQAAAEQALFRFNEKNRGFDASRNLDPLTGGVWTSTVGYNRFFFYKIFLRRIKSFFSSLFGFRHFFRPFFLVASHYFFSPKRWAENFYRRKANRQADLYFRAWVNHKVLNPNVSQPDSGRVDTFRSRVYTNTSIITGPLYSQNSASDYTFEFFFSYFKKIFFFKPDRWWDFFHSFSNLSRVYTLGRSQLQIPYPVLRRVLAFSGRLFPSYVSLYYSTLAPFFFLRNVFTLLLYYAFSSLRLLSHVFFSFFFGIRVDVPQYLYTCLYRFFTSFSRLISNVYFSIFRSIRHLFYISLLFHLKPLAYKFFNLNTLFIHVFPQIQSSFVHFFSLLKKYLQLSNYRAQLSSVRAVFFINHNYTPYDHFFLGDDEAEFVYSGGDYGYFVEEMESLGAYNENESDDSFSDATDSAFPYSELYGTANTPYADGLDTDSNFESNYYLGMSQHSPILDRRPSAMGDIFDDSLYKEFGLDYYFFLYYVLSIGPFDWASRKFVTLSAADDRLSTVHGRPSQVPEDYVFDINSIPSIMLFDKVGVDHGNTQLSVESFSQLTHLATNYQLKLSNSTPARLPDTFSSEISKTLEVSGFSSLLSDDFAKKLTKQDWLELTYFVDELSNPGSNPSGKKAVPILDMDRIKEIWETFAQRCAQFPDVVMRRIETTNFIPRAFDNHFTYFSVGFSLSNPIFKSRLTKFFRFLLGESYGSHWFYTLLIKLDIRISETFHEWRWAYRGDIRALRAIQLFFSGFITAQIFSSALSRLPPLAPPTILALSSYLRRLSILDFDRFRSLVSTLPNDGPIFTLVILSLAEFGQISAVRPASQNSSSVFTAMNQKVEIDYIHNPAGVNPIDRYTKNPTILEGPDLRNRLINFHTTVLSARHPLAVLPFFFVSDFFGFLTAKNSRQKSPSSFPVFYSALSRYRFRDYIPYYKYRFPDQPEQDTKYGRTPPLMNASYDEELGWVLDPSFLNMLNQEELAAKLFYYRIFDEIFTDDLDEGGDKVVPGGPRSVFYKGRLKWSVNKAFKKIVLKRYKSRVTTRTQTSKLWKYWYKTSKKFETPKNQSPIQASDFLFLIQSFTTRQLSRFTRETTDVGLDYGEVHQSEVSGPALSQIRDISLMFAFNDLLTPPGAQYFSAWAPDLGNWFNVGDSDGFDIYDEPIPYDLEWEADQDNYIELPHDDEEEDAEERADLDIHSIDTSELSHNPIIMQEHLEDLDNMSAPSHWGIMDADIENEEPSDANLWFATPNEEDNFEFSDEEEEMDIAVDQAQKYPSTTFFEDRMFEENWLDLDEAEEWQTDRFDLPIEGSTPIARFFVGGLPTMGAFPPADPRLFLGPLSNPAARKSTLHRSERFSAAASSSTTTALVPVVSPEPKSVSIFSALFRLFSSALFRCIAYLYIIIWDAGVRATLHIYDEDPTVKRIKIQANVMLHYYSHIDVYSNKYHFKKFSQSVESWLKDFELYLDKEVRTQQYESFMQTRVFGSLIGPSSFQAYSRFINMFPFRAFPYNTGGYFFEAPVGDEKPYFPFELAEYLRYWYKQYHQGTEPYDPYLINLKSINYYIRFDPFDPAGLANWRLERADDAVWHFMLPYQIEKWSIYENERFSHLKDLPTLSSPRDLGDSLGLTEDDIKRTPPYGGHYASLQKESYYSPGGTDDTDPSYLDPYIDEPADFVDDFAGSIMGGDIPIDHETAPTSIDSWKEAHLDHSNQPYGGLNFDQADYVGDIMGFTDSNDPLLFTYSSAVDLTPQLDEFENRLHVFSHAVFDFFELLRDYIGYAISSFLTDRFFDPLHYWVVYSERFWLLNSIRYGFWINIIRHFFSFSFLLTIVIYLVFILPRLLYYFLGSILDSVVLLALSGLFSIVICLVLPYFFFNVFYRFSNSLTYMDKLVIPLMLICLYIETVLNGHQPAGERIFPDMFYPNSHHLNQRGLPIWTERYIDESPEWAKNTGNGLSGYVDNIREVNERLMQDAGARVFWLYDERGSDFRAQNVRYNLRDRGVFDFWEEKAKQINQGLEDDDYEQRTWSLKSITSHRIRDINPYFALGFIRHTALGANTHFTTGRKKLEVLPNRKTFKGFLALNRTAYYSPEKLYPIEISRGMFPEKDPDFMQHLTVTAKPLTLTQTLPNSLYPAQKRRSFYAHSNDSYYWRHPVSPISGHIEPWSFFNSNMPYNPRYDFRPTSFAHDASLNSTSFFRPNQNLFYNRSGFFPRNRISNIRVPDFRDTFLHDLGGHREFDMTETGEWERSKMTVTDNFTGAVYEVMEREPQYGIPSLSRKLKAAGVARRSVDYILEFTPQERHILQGFLNLRDLRNRLINLYDWHLRPSHVAVLKTLGYGRRNIRYPRTITTGGNADSEHFQSYVGYRSHIARVINNPFSAYFPYYGARNPKTGSRVLDRRVKRRLSKETPGFIRIFRPQDYFKVNNSDHYYTEFSGFMMNTPDWFEDSDSKLFDTELTDNIKKDAREVNPQLVPSSDLVHGKFLKPKEFFELYTKIGFRKDPRPKNLSITSRSLLTRSPPISDPHQVHLNPIIKGRVHNEADFVRYEPFKAVYNKSDPLFWPHESLDVLADAAIQNQKVDRLHSLYPDTPHPFYSQPGQARIPPNAPEPSRILTGYPSQPPFLYSKYFNVYLQANWGYRRALLNSTYTFRFADDDFTHYQHIYSNARRKARDAHFTNFYAKNLRDYLLYFKPHSAYVFNDIYGPDPYLEKLGSIITQDPDFATDVVRRSNLSVSAFKSSRAYGNIVKGDRTPTRLEVFLRQAEYDHSNRPDTYNPNVTLTPVLPDPYMTHIYDQGADKGDPLLYTSMIAMEGYADEPDGVYAGGLLYYFGVPIYRRYMNALWRDISPRRMTDKERNVVLALNFLQRQHQHSFASKVFGDYYFHKRLLEGSRPMSRAHDFFSSRSLSIHRGYSASPILDPYYRAASFTNPSTKDFFPSASSVLSHIPYAAGHSVLPDIDGGLAHHVDPYSIYNYSRKSARFQTFSYTPGPRDRFHFNYLFDDINIYDAMYAMPEDWSYFLTSVDTNEDYLGALSRYESSSARYLNSNILKNHRRTKTTKRHFQFFLRPYRRAFPTWLGEMVWRHGGNKKGSNWPRFHYLKARYPIRRTGPFGGRNLKYYRAQRRHNYGHGRFHKLFDGVTKTMFAHNAEPGAEVEEDPLKIAYSVDGKIDRMLAVSDYVRVQRLKSVYFSEYRKLIGVRPRFIHKNRGRYGRKNRRYIYHHTNRRRWSSFKKLYFHHLRSRRPLGVGHLNGLVESEVYSASPWYVNLADKKSNELALKNKKHVYDSIEKQFTRLLGLDIYYVDNPVTTNPPSVSLDDEDRLPSLVSGDFYKPARINTSSVVSDDSRSLEESAPSNLDLQITKDQAKYFRSFKDELSEPVFYRQAPSSILPGSLRTSTEPTKQSWWQSFFGSFFTPKPAVDKNSLFKRLRKKNMDTKL